ncbi:sodium/solute symporter [Thermodesulfatator autotrophicus]|uniref:Cation acetate symporter n=1 Tax=Thermodesulfatator autotrophicus TaxID=1795632 RepID=A0A177EB40_9BACT|nr:cation acetate symporter [Thermodesulfatator autotrophicus]OAG28402.1 cation acetate symporter [Thermodesulfatator autotrophicus]
MSLTYPIAFLIVAISVLISIYISFYFRKHTRTTAAFYVAEGKIPWRINGMAMFGDYCSAASFLGVAGAISLMGVDGWWLALGFFATWMAVLFLVAAPLKNAGKFTVGDVLGARFGHSKGIRTVSMLTTIVLCSLYLVPQIVGAGHLFKLLLGWEYLTTVIVSGVLITALVVLGGMRGTTFNQAVQGVVLLGAMLILLISATIIYFDGNILNIIKTAKKMVPTVVAAKQIPDVVKSAPSAEAAVEAARQALPDAPSALTPGVGLRDFWNHLSLVLGLFIGVLGLPHILIRFYTVRDAKAAQKSIEFTIWGLAIFYTSVLFVGLAIMFSLYPVLVDLVATGKKGIATNMAVPMLGQKIGGELFLGIIAAGALAAMLSTCTGLLITATTSIAHDLYASIFKPHSPDEERVSFAKKAVFVLAGISIALAIWLKNQNVGMLVGMTFGIAASTFAPALILTVWWPRLTKQGVVWGMATGLVVSLIFTFARFFGLKSFLGLPVLVNPALYSVPAAFIVFIIASLMTKDVGEVEKFMALAHRKK